MTDKETEMLKKETIERIASEWRAFRAITHAIISSADEFAVDSCNDCLRLFLRYQVMDPPRVIAVPLWAGDDDDADVLRDVLVMLLKGEPEEKES